MNINKKMNCGNYRVGIITTNTKPLGNPGGLALFESALTNFLNVPYKSDCLGLKSHETPFSRIV